MGGKDELRGAEADDEWFNAVLRDIGPYCSDLQFIRDELGTALSSNDIEKHIERRIEEEIGTRKADLRILLNRLLKKVDRKFTA